MGSFPSKSMPEFFFFFFIQHTHARPSEEPLSGNLSRNISCVGTDWCKHKGGSPAEMSEAFFDGEMTWMQEKDPASNDA